MPGNPLAADQPLGAFNIIGGDGMVKGFQLQAMVFIPLTGTDVEFGHAGPLIPGGRGVALAQSLSQQIGEKMVVAIPAALVVQGDEEEVSAREVFEGCLPGSGGGEQRGIAEGATQAVEDRRAQ